MRALTVSQPFASLIASGARWVENRTWSPRSHWRGWLAIHAGVGTHYLPRREREARRLPGGAVVAVARLVACPRLRGRTLITMSAPDAYALRRRGISEADILRHPHVAGPVLWVLADVHSLPEPIAARGERGLWEWVPTAVQAARLPILEAVQGSRA